MEDTKYYYGDVYSKDYYYDWEAEMYEYEEENQVTTDPYPISERFTSNVLVSLSVFTSSGEELMLDELSDDVLEDIYQSIEDKVGSYYCEDR